MLSCANPPVRDGTRREPWDTWRSFPSQQQPNYPNLQTVKEVSHELRLRQPLVYIAEIEGLRERIASAGRGEAFLLMGGDCAESFDDSTLDHVRLQIQTLDEMATSLKHGTSLPIIKIGRLAGQYAKPRSVDVEERNGVSLPSYRGDAVNSIEFTTVGRTPDPRRLLMAYDNAATKLQLIRALGEAVEKVTSPQGYPAIDVYSSHEALLLEYESAMIRVDARTGSTYDGSGHFLWIGARTRDTRGAHVELCRQIRNPIGVKLGPDATRDNVLRLLDCLNPDGEEGRLSFITRLGADRVHDCLPLLIETVHDDGRPVTWLTDPMHGNTVTLENGVKTRFFETIIDEIRAFFEVHHQMGTIPGGIHIESTGKDVTEVVGGAQYRDESSLSLRYETLVDPRLNHLQSLELAHRVAQLLISDARK